MSFHADYEDWTDCADARADLRLRIPLGAHARRYIFSHCSSFLFHSRLPFKGPWEVDSSDFLKKKIHATDFKRSGLIHSWTLNSIF